MNLNWFALTIIFIWITSCVGAGLTKDSGCFIVSGGVTLLMCIGYAFYKS